MRITLTWSFLSGWRGGVAEIFHVLDDFPRLETLDRDIGP